MSHCGHDAEGYGADDQQRVQRQAMMANIPISPCEIYAERINDALPLQ
jgi:hypothetical protein